VLLDFLGYPVLFLGCMRGTVCLQVLENLVGNSIMIFIKGRSNDTLRDVMSRLKMASKTKTISVHVPYSILNVLLLQKFYEKGLIASFAVSVFDDIKVTLRYNYKGFGLLDSLKWFSKPSRRVFVKHAKLSTLGGKAYMYFFVNEKGILCYEDLIYLNRGGEYLCSVSV